MKNKNLLYGLIAVLFLSLVANGYLLFRDSQSGGGELASLEEQIEKYPLLSKRILAEIPNDYLVNFVDLRNTIRSTVKPYEKNFAVYFEYLPTGVSIGVNDRDEFTAASLLKVPVVMANLLQEEINGKESMPDKITLTPEMLNSEYGTLYKRGAGATVTRDEAIKYTLEESDNTAVSALISITDYKYFQRVHDGLDIEIKDVQETPVITAKNYSSILRSLFFASIVDKEHSQLILTHLANSVFRDKLVAGVPSDVKVASKVGIGQDKLYSDCGIVYVPRRPYLLCMMSFTDEDTARERMVDVSKKVYDFVSNANKSSSGGEMEK